MDLLQHLDPDMPYFLTGDKMLTENASCLLYSVLLLTCPEPGRRAGIALRLSLHQSEPSFGLHNPLLQIFYSDLHSEYAYSMIGRLP